MPEDVAPVALPHHLHPTPDHSVEALRSQLLEVITRLDSQGVVYLWRLVTWWVSPGRHDGLGRH